MLVMSEIDFKMKKNVYKEAKTGLAKYSTEITSIVKDSAGIKLESTLSVSDEEVLLVRGWTKPGRGHGGNNWKQGGGGGRNKTSGWRSRDDGKTKIDKKLNPKGEDGEVRICLSCGSYHHLLAVS